MSLSSKTRLNSKCWGENQRCDQRDAGASSTSTKYPSCRWSSQRVTAPLRIWLLQAICTLLATGRGRSASTKALRSPISSRLPATVSATPRRVTLTMDTSSEHQLRSTESCLAMTVDLQVLYQKDSVFFTYLAIVRNLAQRATPALVSEYVFMPRKDAACAAVVFPLLMNRRSPQSFSSRYSRRPAPATAL